jgi:SAM-dependent methyltransferase
MNHSTYYKDAGKMALASRISMRARERMFERFMKSMQPKPCHKVLDIGVTSDQRNVESNYFEKMYPYRAMVVCVGTEDASYLERAYPGIKFLKIQPNQRLPFEDREFDLSFSNAVIEHVGSTENQRAFVREMLRVSRCFYLTTPNRWFPIELHTALPFLHFLPPRIFRRVLSAFGEHFWSREENLNLLDLKQLSALYPHGSGVRIEIARTFGMASHLIAYGHSTTVPDALER